MGGLRQFSQTGLGILAGVAGVLAIFRFLDSLYRAASCCRSFSWGPIDNAMTLVLQLAALGAVALYARSRV